MFQLYLASRTHVVIYKWIGSQMIFLFQHINIIFFLFDVRFQEVLTFFLFLTLSCCHEKHMPASPFKDYFLTRIDAQVPLKMLECLIYGVLYTNLFGLMNHWHITSFITVPFLCNFDSCSQHYKTTTRSNSSRLEKGESYPRNLDIDRS